MEDVELHTSRQLDSVRLTWNTRNCTHLDNLIAFGSHGKLELSKNQKFKNFERVKHGKKQAA